MLRRPRPQRGVADGVVAADVGSGSPAAASPFTALRRLRIPGIDRVARRPRRPADAPTTAIATAAAEGTSAQLPVEAAPRPRRVTKKRIALAVVVGLLVTAAAAYTQKDRYSAHAAELSRDIIGDENTARVESWYFRVQDQVDQWKYRLFGGDTNPFESRVIIQYVPVSPKRTYVIDVSAPVDLRPINVPNLIDVQVMVLPKTKALRDTLESGEGVWTTSGMPRSSPSDMLMARTFIRPDKTRPYALVGVAIADARRIRLHMIAGTAHPGGDLGVKGPGVMAKDDLKKLLIAWNGGFQGPHGGYGMYADGKTYRSLRNGLASVAVTAKGEIRMGEWGKSLKWEEGMVAVRQNAVLLVDNCEVSPRTREGNDTWGYVNVNSAEFITWRSAIGLTKEGNLLIAAGNSLSAETLAKAMWAAGACTAMQLDINTPYVLTGLYFPQPDGTVQSTKFMDAMPDNPARFFKTQERDFMYITVDESRYAN